MTLFGPGKMFDHKLIVESISHSMQSTPSVSVLHGLPGDVHLHHILGHLEVAGLKMVSFMVTWSWFNDVLRTAALLHLHYLHHLLMGVQEEED